MSVLQGQFEVSEIICTYLQTSQGEYEKMVPEQVKQREKCKEPIYLHIHVLLRGSKVLYQKLKALCDCFCVILCIWAPALCSLAVAVFVTFLSVTVNDDTQTL